MPPARSRPGGRAGVAEPALAAALPAHRSGDPAVTSSSLGRRTFRQPVFVRRTPASSGGPSTAPGGATRVSSAGRSSNGLKRFAAFDVPWRAHSSTASAAASSRAGSRSRSSGWNGARTWSTKPAVRRPDPDPQPAELLVPELVDDRSEAVVAARPAALAEAELAERQGEVVDDDEQVAERRVLAGEDLPDGEAGVVHPRQRLDERQVEAAVAAHRDRRRVPRPALARPAGAVGDPVEHHPADVVARLRVLVARVAQADDDLHAPQRAACRTRRTGPIPSGRAREMVSAPPVGARRARRARPTCARRPLERARLHAPVSTRPHAAGCTACARCPLDVADRLRSDLRRAAGSPARSRPSLRRRPRRSRASPAGLRDRLGRLPAGRRSGRTSRHPRGCLPRDRIVVDVDDFDSPGAIFHGPDTRDHPVAVDPGRTGSLTSTIFVAAPARCARPCRHRCCRRAPTST